MTKPFLRRNVPLWTLLLVIAAFIISVVQICADIDLHIEESKRFISDMNVCAEGIARNLQNAYEETNNSEKVEASLIGAYLYSEELQSLLYREPMCTILGKKLHLFSGIDAPPDRVFPHVASQLKGIRDEYLETKVLSETSQSLINELSMVFLEFCDSGSNQAISRESFTERLNTLCIKLYTKVYAK